MLVKIKRIDQDLDLPIYETGGAVGFDLLARTNIIISPQAIELIPSNVIVQVPPDHMLMIAPRSSTPRKKNLIFPHSIGIIDQDYCGPNDEIMIQVYNIGQDSVLIKRGEKIAQGILVKITKADFVETELINQANRGGFGSTDK